ncbi:MAG: EF-hand domain-containing protein [Hyphomicrobiaceae bacterium]|nr:EF-hand domain-containing protein [Hyphomicrobiaceae bacterium]
MIRTTFTGTLFGLVLAGSALAQSGQPGLHFIEVWDLDQNGTVTLEEAEQRRGDVFLSFDADGNGVLDAEEYAVFDEARASDAQQHGTGMGRGGQRAQEGMTLAYNDTDVNGEVTREEFLARTADWLALIDRNGDGAVTAEDFGPGRN